jgi:hypothetical protein
MMLPKIEILILIVISIQTTTEWSFAHPDGYDKNKTSEVVPLESLEELSEQLEMKTKLFEERIKAFELLKQQVDEETKEYSRLPSILEHKKRKETSYKHLTTMRIIIYVLGTLLFTILFHYAVKISIRHAKSLYAYTFSYFYLRYWCSTRDSLKFKHDKLAKYNNQVALITVPSTSSKEVFVRSQEVYTRPAPFEENLNRRVGKVTHGVELNDCSMCLRSLIGIKREGLSFKATECGHVYCLSCMNNWLASSTLQLKCPTCLHELKRDQIIRVRNIYI